MASNNILLIPHLSKELNLIGLSSLPYNVRKVSKSNSKYQVNKSTLKVVFDSNLMIETLISVSFELVKQIKASVEIDDSDVDKLHFENMKLEKQLKMCKSELAEKIKEIAAAKELSRQLQEKINHLEKEVKNFKLEQKTLIKKSQSNEDLLKHAIKKKELSILELHKAAWKQFNLADQNYFPKNFEIIHLNQPDLRHLWSTVKYSSVETKEEALKQAAIILQNNNRALKEEIFQLKTFLLQIFEEFKRTLKLMVDQMNVPDLPVLGYKSSDIFVNTESFNISVYNKFLNESFGIITKICELFNETNFKVSGDTFVCWSNIMKGLSAYLQ